MASTARRRKTVEEIRRNMSAIRSSENKAEAGLRRAVHALGLRFRKYRKDVTGCPDFVFLKERVAVFVDGDYWHARLLREGGSQKLLGHFTREQRPYWIAKLKRNVLRDEAVNEALDADGWLVLRFWESDVRNNLCPIADHVRDVVLSRRRVKQ